MRVSKEILGGAVAALIAAGGLAAAGPSDLGDIDERRVEVVDEAARLAALAEEIDMITGKGCASVLLGFDFEESSTQDTSACTPGNVPSAVSIDQGLRFMADSIALEREDRAVEGRAKFGEVYRWGSFGLVVFAGFLGGVATRRAPTVLGRLKEKAPFRRRSDDGNGDDAH